MNQFMFFYDVPLRILGPRMISAQSSHDRTIISFSATSLPPISGDASIVSPSSNRTARPITPSFSVPNLNVEGSGATHKRLGENGNSLYTCTALTAARSLLIFNQNEMILEGTYDLFLVNRSVYSIVNFFLV